MSLLQKPRLLLAGVAVISWAAVGAALVSQYQFGMLPCPWCTLQRLIFLVLGLLAALGALLPWAGLRRGLAALGALMALCGIASALWQYFVAAAGASCKLTLADRIMEGLGLYDLAPDVFVPQASCADAVVSLLGVPYAFWGLALFALCGVACSAVLMARRGT